MTEMGVAELFEAARAGDGARLNGLLDDVPSGVGARDDAGASLLHVAAERDDVALATELLTRGADPEAESGWGQTAFEWAANLGSQKVAELLLERGARRHGLWTAAALGRSDEVRARLEDPAREPALSDAFHIACRNGHLDAACLLADAGADLDARGYFGASALHWAAIGGHEEVVRWLVAEGAETGGRDPEFEAAPAGWAREGGHSELASFLEAAERGHVGGEREAGEASDPEERPDR